MSDSIIEIKNLCFAYGNHQVFKDFNLVINKGETVGLIGANGCGKSTLMKTIVGLLAYEGEIKVQESVVSKKNLDTIRKQVGFVFQDANNQLFMPRVYDDVAFGPRNYGYSKDEVDHIVEESLAKLGISELKDRQNYKMSGGEKKMVSIATILAMKPEVILLDEPSITLDPYNRRNLIKNLNNLEQTKIIATHDLDMVLETCDRVVLLSKEGIVADGKCEDILHDKELLEKCHLELPYSLQQYSLNKNKGA